MQFYPIFLAVLALWLLALSILLYKLLKLFKKLTKGVEEDLSKKGFEEVRKRLDFLEDDGKHHVQKVGLVRYNPFKELGGDHSFSLAILDGVNSGIVITGLHTRDRTRIYMKEIVKGKSVHDLSADEKRALEEAVKK
jgi:hypothetical protein